MISKKNEIYIGANNRKSLYDIEIPTDCNGELVIFVHGYKGYKDWGAWNLVQSEFVKEGFAFAKLNLSHNGGTTENPIDFPDLQAFGENRYSYEVVDVKTIINLLKGDFQKVHLIGHSRGGGIVMLAGTEVDSVTTWAGISSIENRFPKIDSEEEKAWKSKGVRYVINGRTKQEMPHFYSMMEDFVQHKSHLDIENASKICNGRTFHIHGDKDQAVGVEEAKSLSNWTGGNLLIVENGDHTFGSKHPWEKDELPKDLQLVVNETIKFIKNGK